MPQSNLKERIDNFLGGVFFIFPKAEITKWGWTCLTAGRHGSQPRKRGPATPRSIPRCTQAVIP
jgi:hypothetical protein